MHGTKIGQRSLQEIEDLLREEHYHLLLQTSDKRISVTIVYWSLLTPPFILTVKCFGREQYGMLYWNLAEICEEEPFDLTRFEFVANPRRNEEEVSGNNPERTLQETVDLANYALHKMCEGSTKTHLERKLPPS